MLIRNVIQEKKRNLLEKFDYLDAFQGILFMLKEKR
jgi:hypothetical protein